MKRKRGKKEKYGNRGAKKRTARSSVRSLASDRRKPKAQRKRREDAPIVHGVFDYSGDGYGFCRVEDGSRADVFIPPDATAGAMTGDTVSVAIRRSEGTRTEGEVVSFDERANGSVVGTVIPVGARFYIKPKNAKLRVTFRVEGGVPFEAGDLVLAVPVGKGYFERSSRRADEYDPLTLKREAPLPCVVTKNYGAAIFLFAFVVKVVLLYFSAKSKKSMMRQARFTPYLKELEARYEGNKQKYQEEVAKLYKEEGINPMGGCLWSLLPFPILLALYRAIRFPITIMMGVSAEAYALIQEKLTALGFESAAGARAAAYAQIYESQFITRNFDQFAGISDKLKTIDYSFLGLDLGVQPNFRFWQFSAENGGLWSQWGLFLIPVVAALLSWVQSKISTASSPQDSQTASTSKTMLLMMPLMSLWIGFVMPGALGLYWIATSVFQIIQDYFLTKFFTKQLDAEDAERNARLKAKADEIDRKREETKRLREEGATVVNPNTSKRKVQKGEKQKLVEGTNKWENANRPRKEEEEEPSRVGDRPYARGRAYVADRFGPNAPAEETEPAPEETPAAPAEVPSGESSILEGEIGADDKSEDNGE